MRYRSRGRRSHRRGGFRRHHRGMRRGGRRRSRLLRVGYRM